ncbi:MAG: hypothetical protein ACO3A4_11425 [Silvanigrellaceae bacterium]
MKSWFLLLPFVLLACQPKGTSTLDSQKKSLEDAAVLESIGKRVSALKLEGGMLSCSGMDKKMNLVRTRAVFSPGKIESLTIASYADKTNPSNVLNDLSPDLKKHELFEKELTSRALRMEIDLEGKRFNVEVIAAVNGEPHKIYDLDFQAQSDGEGGKILSGFLSYKDISLSLDLSEVLVGCALLPKP